MEHNNNPILDSEISIQELDKCIKSKDTSPGLDDISYSMIKNLPDAGKSLLIRLFNNFFEHSFVPSQWRDICIIPIPKPGRDPSTVSSLRPISLLSCICKIFHYVLFRRLEWFLEKSNTFSDNTVGFRGGRSCLDGLSCLISTIQTGFSEGYSTIGCFLDINDAYNNVNNSVLINVLDDLKVGARICKYLWNFLHRRVLKIRSGNSCISRHSGCGLAQGDPLSPLLFNIITLDICKKLQNNICISQYADDFAIYVQCSSVSDGQCRIQSSLDVMNDLLTHVGLDISPTKSKICWFSRGYHRPTIEVRVNGTSLELVDHVKYLGVWLDKGLRWNKQINEVRERVLKLINIFKVLVGPGWGIHPNHLRRLYISLIRSRIDFGSFLLDNSADTHLIKLDRLQNICMRLVGGYIKSTPIHVMESELMLPPLFIRRRYLAGKFYLKSKCFGFPVIDILDKLHGLSCNSAYWRKKKKPLLVLSHDFLKQEHMYCSNKMGMFSMTTWVSNMDLSGIVKPNLDSVDKPKHCYNVCNLRSICSKSLNALYSGFYCVYTDGSKGKNFCGAAFYDSYNNAFFKFKIRSKVSIMHLELIAIAEALAYIESLDGDQFVIFTDSKSALLHLMRCTSSSVRGLPLAYSILRAITDLVNKHKTVVLQWIPSHVGLEGNEVVDRLANEAGSDGEIYSCSPWHTELLPLVRDRCIQSWSEYFDKRSLTKGIWYRTIQPSLPRTLWFSEGGMTRQEVVTALRLRSGHIPLNSFGFMMRKVDSPNCVVCGVIEDVHHILSECVRIGVQRRQAFVNSFNVGFYNSVLASPLSDEARTLYHIIIMGIRLRVA